MASVRSPSLPSVACLPFAAMSSNVCLSMPPVARRVLLTIAALATVIVVIVGGVVVTRAELYGSSYRSSVWGVELTVPRGWELTEQSSYPGILARGVEHRGGARLSLAATQLAPGETVRTALARSERGLKKLGYNVAPTSAHPFGAMLLEAATPDKKRLVRQAYLTQNGILYVLSLASPSAIGQRYVHTFDETLRSMRFTLPVGTLSEIRPDGGVALPDAARTP